MTYSSHSPLKVALSRSFDCYTIGLGRCLLQNRVTVQLRNLKEIWLLLFYLHPFNSDIIVRRVKAMASLPRGSNRLPDTSILFAQSETNVRRNGLLDFSECADMEIFVCAVFETRGVLFSNIVEY